MGGSEKKEKNIKKQRGEWADYKCCDGACSQVAVYNFVTNSSPASTFMFIYASNSDLNEKMPCTGGISLQGDKV